MALFGFGKKKEEEARLAEQKKREEAQFAKEAMNSLQEQEEKRQKEIDAKLEMMNEVRKHFNNHPGILLVDYQNLSIDQDSNLRSFLREKGLVVRVFKNELAKEVVRTTEFSGASDKYSGSLITVFFDTEEQLMAVAKYSKDNELTLDVKYSKLGENTDVYSSVLERV